MPTRIETYDKALKLIHMENSPKIKQIIKRLESEGRTEKSICFAIWKSHEKLNKYFRQINGQIAMDSRFFSIFENEIKKWSWASNDQRWKEYNKRKQEEQKAEQLRIEQERLRKLNSEYKKIYPGFIYFIQGESGGPIKIGFAENVKARLQTLQTGHFDNLIILATYPGKMSQEKQLHKKFEGIRLRGEWFKPERELLELIEKVNKSKKPNFDSWVKGK